MRKLFMLLALPLSLFAQTTEFNNTLLPAIQSFANTGAVTNREEEAINYINVLFEKGICKKDKLRNLVISIGSGSPKDYLRPHWMNRVMWSARYRMMVTCALHPQALAARAPCFTSFSKAIKPS